MKSSGIKAGGVSAIKQEVNNEAPPSSDASSRTAPTRKFTPTLVARRRKTEESSSSSDISFLSADAAATSDDAFAGLIKQASKEGGFGVGHGRGRGRSSMQKFQVTFSGGSGSIDPSQMPLAPRKFSRPFPGGFPPFAPGSRPGFPGIKSEPGSNNASEDPLRIKQEGLEDDLGAAEEGDGHPGSESNYPPGFDPRFAAPQKPRRALLDYRQYYPIIVPLRTPGAEFYDPPELDNIQRAPPVPDDTWTTTTATGEAAEETVAAALGLEEDNNDEESGQIFLVQMPAAMPIGVPEAALETRKQQAMSSAAAASAGRKGAAEAADVAAQRMHSQAAKVHELPSGFLGKLVVFKSGKVCLKMGDVLLDVSQGLKSEHRQDVAAINPQTKHCVFVGDVTQRLVISPNLDQLIFDLPVPEKWGVSEMEGVRG
uniref:DNA-directed RNA polymerase III subunit RPC4 n=1 Tax=Polytomella parva TaxID=51329 RepID=A0A7S0UXZ5_9CHLO|mmetsp:Transcript_2229/g.3368  ORF Transcript_2229/g.3368 Transcript_2229/m.3368 type:complete len:427 (+) Transcript_2229:148-1428(+)|eukprot:CAMPEP_0175072344 /NCGR_PEP_ID=MMETSP0052_2-20121109/19846_1 /TAXON_ID=51329 ORGANISM="Polytomella parva, Strain SAG 63-3" /NCGR_SAMPLE_ID=MMETSP0052_2 /ASSEMBLY_ACC=CAM_ASM_000194 /LENGTH=426 /DNA_ID=CAMNT_0016339815 /DNA_START=86 /DNA_END=1366 /DNA_ORIENTATION=+